MNSRELDKITDLVLDLLKEKGISVSKSGSLQAETGSNASHADSSERSPFKMDPMLIPVFVTGRTAFLTKADMEKCFGGTALTKDESLSHGSRVVFKETVTVCGPDGEISDVHVSCSSDDHSRVELLSGDDLILGIKAPLRLSSDIKCSPGLGIAGPFGSSKLKEGAIIPLRKITLDPPHAKHYGVRTGQVVSVEVSGSRGGIFTNVAVIIEDGLDPVCLLDVNEAGAMCINDKTMVKIVK